MTQPAERIIWQYWETRGEKPRYIDGLHEIAKRNAGVKIILVAPHTLAEYLPDLEPEILLIEEMAHKADMIRTRLVQRYGGMWLDSDAVVLGDLNWLFDLLVEHEFVGFNDEGRLQGERPWVRVNCFLSRPQGRVVSGWVEKQRHVLSRRTFEWDQIGARMLNEVCLMHPETLKILPFEKICPIPWNKVENFLLKNDELGKRIVDTCYVVMLSNHAIKVQQVPLPHLTVEEIAAGEYVLSRIMQWALALADRRASEKSQ